MMMQLAKRIPFENPDVLLMVRGLYILSNVLILGLYIYTQSKINAKKGMSCFFSNCSGVGRNSTNIPIYRHDNAQVRRARTDG